MKKSNLAQEKTNILFELFKSNKYSDAQKLAKSLILEYPRNQFAWKVLGALLGRQGKNLEAIDAHKKAVELDPNDQESYCNLGVTLQSIGKLKEAEVYFTKAINLKPDHAKSYFNLGNNFIAKNNLQKAEFNYTKAIELKSDYAEAYNNLANTLIKLGNTEKAISLYCKAIKIYPNYMEALNNFGINIKNVRYNSWYPDHYPILIKLITELNIIRPIDIAKSVISLLMHDPNIKNILIEKTNFSSLQDATDIIDSLDKIPLLHHLMRISPMPSLKFENLFINLRKYILNNLASISPDRKNIYFLNSLALHCFINEYVYYESDEETRLIKNLEIEIAHSIKISKQPSLIEILCLGAYRPFLQYDWTSKLRIADQLKELKIKFIDEPLTEKALKKTIPLLNPIFNDISKNVRQQYEQHPYPRWEKLALSFKKKSIANISDEIPLKLNSQKIKDNTSLEILIAGCGTGRQSIEVATMYANCHVTAVDLSLTSLAYAKRKSDELNVNNISYLQADILDLYKLDKKFDIIECSGVLHHMDKPLDGWEVLKNLLKPYGLMRIGLYSELARKDIKKIRDAPTFSGSMLSDLEIKKFRKSLINSQDADLQRTIKGRDFFSLSSFRDLVLHVQERRFTIPQIQDCLEELKLSFCGFENKQIIGLFKNTYGANSDIHDLNLWHQFEEKNPNTFAGMYQFWCQKF